MIKKRRKLIVILSMLLLALGGFLVGMKQQNEKYTRIEWVHELHQRFNTDPGDCDYEFADLEKSSKYYEDAVWAKNLGMFGENPENIYPNRPVTREFAASSLNKCLNLQLSEEDNYTYIDVDSVQCPEDDQIAVKRGWFELENGYFEPDAVVNDNEVQKMLEDTENIISMAEVDPDYESTFEYAVDVVEIPADAAVEIKDDEHVVIGADNVTLKDGDRFVVYEDGLPLAYVAKKVNHKKDQYQIQVEKADHSVYEYVDEQGSLELTPENSEFIPAEGVEVQSLEGTAKSSTSANISYADGKLSLITTAGGVSTEIWLSDLRLNHSFGESGYTVSVSGKWGITDKYTSSGAIIDDLTLGEIRIHGIGFVRLSFTLSKDIKVQGDVSGTFCAGVSVLQDGTTRGINQFNVGGCSVNGEGSLTATLKLSAGVDVVVACADIYGEVGIKTQYATQVKENSSKVMIHCQDYKYYIFFTVGAEAKYYAFWSGKMETLANKKLSMDEKKSPFIKHWHWENGKSVSYCTMGMSVPDLDYSGGTTAVAGTITEKRERILETDIVLKNDAVIPQDFAIGSGSLDLNGHTLTVQGDFLHSGGTVKISYGILNVEGNYRLQSKPISGDAGTYAESKGSLIMEWTAGKLNVGKDFIMQSTAESTFERGTLNIAGNFEQKNTEDRKNNFVGYSNFIMKFTGGTEHTITFEDAMSNSIANLESEGNLDVKGGLKLCGNYDLDGHKMSVEGDLLQPSGVLYINNGELNISGDYYIAGSRKVEKDGTEYLTGSSAALRMIKEADIVRVKGDFLTYTSQAHGDYLVEGTIYFGGNFTQKRNGNDYSFNTKTYAGSHRTVFNGNKKQIIKFESPQGSGFKNVTFANTNIELASGIRGFSLNEDINLTINTEEFGVYIFPLELNGHSLGAGKVNGKETLKFTDGTLDLGGSKVLVDGDLLQAGGTLYIDGGELDVTGDYYLVSKRWMGDDGVTEWKNSSSGILEMVKEKDVVRVGENFLTYSTEEHSDQLTAGTLYIQGDFRQMGGPNTYCDKNFNTTGTHRVVFEGKKQQKIRFDAPSYSGFANVSFTNPDIILESGIRGFDLNDDIKLTINTESFGVYSRSLKLNGHSVGTGKINGKEILKFTDGIFDLGGSKVLVDGHLLQSGGTMYIDGGELDVTGDYYLAGNRWTGDDGNERVNESQGALEMVKEKDIVKIGGNFLTYSKVEHTNYLTNGTMYVKGNFRQIGGLHTYYEKNFNATGKHRIVFDGEKKQQIQFDDLNYSGFMNVTFANPDIELESGIRGFDLNEDINLTINTESFGIYSRSLKLNGHSVGTGKINGKETLKFTGGILDLGGSKVLVNGHLIQSGGTMYIDGGELDVTGDYYLAGNRWTGDDGNERVNESQGALEMVKEKDIVKIGGNFLTYSKVEHTNYLTNGTMYVKGNFRQIGGLHTYYEKNFNATGKHRIVFDGEKKQQIQFDDLNYSGFMNVTFANPDIELESGIRGFDLNEDINLTINTESFGIYSRSLKLNGHSVGTGKINGKETLKFTGGTFDLGGSKVFIDGDLIQAGGDFDLGGGKILVDGNLLQSAGMLYINEGELEVTGDYYLASDRGIGNDGNEWVNNSKGILKMVKADDIVKVNGNFLTYYSANTTNPTTQLTAGTLYIKGNFRQMGSNDYENQNFNAIGTHRVVFEGEKQQQIRFDAPSYSGFANVTFTNPNIELESGIRGFDLNEDINLTINTESFGVYNKTLKLNGHSVGTGKINGKGTLKFTTGTLDLGGSRVLVDGDLLQSGGTLYIDGGELDVTGDYYLASDRGIDNDGNEWVNNSSGILKMVKEEDVVKVDGNFLTSSENNHTGQLAAGTLYIKGNFKQKGTSNSSYKKQNFNATGTHTVVLDGEGVQNVSFESSQSKFNNLYLTKEKDTGYTFSPDNCWNKLYINTAVSEVQISPTDISLEKGDSLQLKAKVFGINKPSQKVEWSIEGAQSEGTEISESGLLKIALRENAQTLTVKAVSVEDNSKFAIVTVKVLPATVTVDQVKIRPNVSSVFAGEELQLSAKVSGTNEPSQEVKWSLSGNKSSDTTISADGLLKVAKDETAETLQITAVSEEDKEKSATVIVEVLREEEELPFVEKVTISPKTVSVNPGDHTLFQAKVLGRNNPSGEVSWTVEGNTSENTVIADGMLTVGADETAETLKVTATSAFDPAKSASASVEVVTVEISSTVENVVVSLKQGTVTRFYARVLGANNPSQNVIWSLEGNVSKDTVITEDGELTIAKDETAETLVVTAISTENREKSGVLAFHVLENDTTPQTPEKPEAEEITSASVRLDYTAGYEYSLDAKNWQNDPFFDGLESDTEYTFFQRVKETVVNYASEASEGLTIATLPIKDNHEHTFGEPSFTWSEDGKSCTVTFVCTENPEHTESYEAAVSNTVKVKATCSQMGTTEYKAVYGAYSSTKEMQDIPLDAKNHVGGTEIRNAKEATCEEEGYTGDICCKGCGETLQRGTGIEKKEHTWNQGEVVKGATCTENGERKYTCTICKTTKTEVISATGHERSENVRNQKEATCEEEGYTGDIYCKKCGETLQKGTVIASTGHKETELRNVKVTTCESDGYSGDTYCKDCGEKLESGTVIPATGHSFGEYEVVKEPTSTEEGLKSRTCSVCGKVESVTIPKKENTDQKKTETKDTDKNQQQTETPDTKPNQQPKPAKKTTKKIKLNRKKLTLKKGKTFKLKVTLTPKDSQDKITYKTSNKKIATVSKTGKIKAKKKGTAKITVISGKKKAVCTVKVK